MMQPFQINCKRSKKEERSFQIISSPALISFRVALRAHDSFGFKIKKRMDDNIHVDKKRI